MTVPYATPPTAVAGAGLPSATWNSNVRDSIESVARPPSVTVSRATTFSVPNAGVVNLFPWTAVVAQTDPFWTAASPTKLIVPANLGGKYLVVADPIYDINGAGGRYAGILKNGLGVWQVNSGGSAAWYTTLSIATIVDLIPGDYVELGLYQNSGAAINTRGDIYLINMTMTRIGV